MNLKWIEPESRFLIGFLFRRKFDGMTDSAKRIINWGVLGLDVGSAWILLALL